MVALPMNLASGIVWIRVLDAGQITGARAGADVVEQVVVARDLPSRLRPMRGPSAVLIEQVAEGDGIGRAGVLTGGLHRIDRDAERFRGDLHLGGWLAGGEHLLLLTALLADLGILQALHAVGALFHHTAHADRDVRVLLKVRRPRRPVFSPRGPCRGCGR